jgi:hypothetical protein
VGISRVHSIERVCNGFVRPLLVFLKKNQPIRLPGLSLDLARDGEPFDTLTALSCIEWPAEPKSGVCSELILSGAFYPDLKIGVWRPRTYQVILDILFGVL